MSDSKVMIKAPMKEVKARFSDYEDMEFERRGDWTLIEDYSGTQLFGWGTSAWVELAGQNELIYAYYDEDMNAEFVHVKDGVCLRAFMQYDDEVATDEGQDPDSAIAEWSDVADYIDEHMA